MQEVRAGRERGLSNTVCISANGPVLSDEGNEAVLSIKDAVDFFSLLLPIIGNNKYNFNFLSQSRPGPLREMTPSNQIKFDRPRTT